MIDPFQHAALVHVRVVHHLLDIAHRAERDPVLASLFRDLRLGQRPGPCGDDRGDFLDVLQRGRAWSATEDRRSDRCGPPPPGC